MEPKLQQLLDEAEIRRVHIRYCRGVDRMDWDLGQLYRITDETDFCIPLAGWEYRDLLMPTDAVESFRIHLGLDDGSIGPATIDLTNFAEIRSGQLPSSQNGSRAESCIRAAEAEIFKLRRLHKRPGTRRR